MKGWASGRGGFTSSKSIKIVEEQNMLRHPAGRSTHLSTGFLCSFSLRL